MSIVWWNGALVTEEHVRISPFDHGLTTGDGVFETLRVYRGVPFAVRRHIERLQHSARGLRLQVPSVEALPGAMLAVLEANRLQEARLRVTLTAGRAPLGSERVVGESTVLIAASPMRPWPPTEDIWVVPWPRNEAGALVGLKTTSYADNVLALDEARAHGAGEAVFANTQGNLCEGTGSNIFFAKDGELFTPTLGSGCLAGITRAVLIERIPVKEVDFPVTALAESDEAFLTSSTREVHPIERVNGKRLPKVPGPCTAAAQRVFAELLAKDMNP